MRPAGPGGPQAVRAALDRLTAAPTDVAGGLSFTRVGLPPGSAPTVLLVHGAGAARLVWAPVLTPLAERYDVLVVDLPGHGDSPPLRPGEDPRCAAVALRLAAACVELGVVRPHVVGNSLGGWIGLEMAADDAAASLLALAPAGLRIRPVPPSPILRINRVLAKRTGRLAEAALGRSAVRWVVFATGSAAPAALHPDLARGMVAALASSTAYHAMLAATAHTRFERKHEVAVPTTVVFGDRDWILPSPNQRHELAPDHARWLTIPHCGHAPMWDAPQETIRLVEETVGRAAGDRA